MGKQQRCLSCLKTGGLHQTGGEKFQLDILNDLSAHSKIHRLVLLDLSQTVQDLLTYLELFDQFTKRIEAFPCTTEKVASIMAYILQVR